MHSHDITALIRDPEAHERALFTFASPDPASLKAKSRKSVFPPNGEVQIQCNVSYLGLKPTTAVGRILGDNLLEQIRKKDKDDDTGKAEVDVGILLKGAEKLCAV